MPRHPPRHDGRIKRAAGYVIVPASIVEVAGERQLIGSAVIFAQYLDWQSCRWNTCAIEFRQSSFSCSHLQFP